MPELSAEKSTTEFSVDGPQIETVIKNDQLGSFSSKRKDELTWQLLVNRDHFLSQGFLPEEIDGATALEQERLLAQISVKSPKELAGLREWQRTGKAPELAPFMALFERLGALRKLEEKNHAKADNARAYLQKIASRTPSAGLCDQLLQAILQRTISDEPTPPDKIVSNILSNLAREETLEGRKVSALDALTSSSLSFGGRSTWLEKRFLPRFEFLHKRDQKKATDEKTQDEKPQNEDLPQEPPTTPPQVEDECEQHRGKESKGEAQPIFTIDPYHPGYWEAESYSKVDETTGRLSKGAEGIRKPVNAVENEGETLTSIKGSSGANLFSLPLSPNMTINNKSILALQKAGTEIMEDGGGHIYLKFPQNQTYEVMVSRRYKQVDVNIPADLATVETVLPAEIETKLAEIKAMNIDSIEKAVAWQGFIQTFFTYPQDSQVEVMYQQADATPSSRLTSMTQGKLLDCYLAREFLIAGIKRLDLSDLEWRGVNGHFLNAKEKDGTGYLHSGTGHGWLKARLIGSSEWFILDATPAGDPNKADQGATQQFDDSSSLITEEDMKEIEDDVTGGSDKPKGMTSEESYVMQFAQEAGVETDEARAILNTLEQVDQLKDRNGRNILQRVKEQFDRIIQTYTQQKIESGGTVEMSRGRDLVDPVEALIDVRTGSLDPKGFAKRVIGEEKLEFYGGFDMEIIADGSFSMNEPIGGIIKYVAQQHMSYLLHRGAHYFAQEARRRKLRLVTPLAVRSSQYMFRGNNIEAIKTLTEGFTAPQMAILWKKSAENIGGGTPAHLGLKAILDSITPDEVELLKSKKLLKIVALISDGGYDDSDEVQRLTEQLEEMNVIVAPFTITDARSLEQLPESVAEKIIEATRGLMPERIR